MAIALSLISVIVIKQGVSLEGMENVFSESWRKRIQLRRCRSLLQFVVVILASVLSLFCRRTTSDEKKVESSKEKELNFLQ